MHKFFIFCGGLLFQFSLHAAELGRANAGHSFEIQQTVGVAGCVFEKAPRDDNGKVILNIPKGPFLSEEELAKRKVAFNKRKTALGKRMKALGDVFPKQDVKNDAEAIEEWDKKFLIERMKKLGEEGASKQPE